MDKLTSNYIKAFNHAYFLAEHKPSLIELILKTSSDTEFIRGLKDGRKTFELDKNKKRINEIQNIHSNKPLDRDLER